MIITGSSVPGSTTLSVKRDFRIRTRLALQWVQTASGNWIAVDRGAAEDVYESTFTVYGTYAKVSTLIAALQLNRAAAAGTPNQIAISSVSAGEYVFGCDVDYSTSVAAIITDFGRVKQGSWKGYGVTLEARALSPTFTGSPSLPAFQYVDIGYEGDRDWTVTKLLSSTGAVTNVDENCDAGTLKLAATLTNANMQALRRYLATQRGATISFPAPSGITYPFGPRGTTGTHNMKVVAWEDLGQWGLQYWRMRLTLAEVV